MEPNADTKKTSAPPNKMFIAIIILIVAIIGATAVIVFMMNRNSGEQDSGPTIGYATNATVMLDQQSVQAAMDEAVRNARDGRIGLSYRNDAYSEDGSTFECRIANSIANYYDMFLTIYADAELTDQIYLSGLVPPGSGFQQITLDHPLDPGDHRVYVVLTQVKTNEDGEQVLAHQASYTMDFHVTQ